MEEWKDIKGYEGIYQVSNLGRIKSLERIDNSNHKVKGKILKIIPENRGYSVVNLCKDGKCKTYKVHRLVAIAFLENPDNKPQVNHIDGNKKNNSILNLEWVTAEENINHAWDTGLSKITDESREKMSNSRKGSKNHFYGKTHTDESKRKISESRIGKYLGKDNPFYGKHHSEETKEKLRETRKKYTGSNHPRAKKVICITTGEIFNYSKQAAEKYNINANNIYKCCRGECSYAGEHPITKEKLTWEYLE